MLKLSLFQKNDLSKSTPHRVKMS